MTYFSSHDRVLTAYRDRLAGLAGMKGRRNASLLGIANLGILAGLPDCQLEQEIRSASGTPPLTVAEVRHALRTARRDTAPLNTDRPPVQTTWKPTPPPTPPLGSGAASFVRRMIARGQGATFETLAGCSPLPIPAGTSEQTALFLRTLYKPTEFIFCGNPTDWGKFGVNIKAVADWTEATLRGETLAPLLIANPLTGRQGMTKEGKPSYRCAACVAAYRFALVEFDEMQLSDQCAFWSGVIRAGTLPLRSLTYSGGKSLHGLVEIGAGDACAWAREIEILLYATCNPDAPEALRADRACKNPDRLSRLAGVVRPDKGGAQSLLWLG